ncbi:hypothetical protein HII13_001700 [Brettanomyces bruxellensis]|nr:hypothetical protein HII13_001700 [Brettanomyces bruxellensis]
MLSITLLLSTLLAEASTFSLTPDSSYFLVLQPLQRNAKISTIPITSFWYTENGWTTNSTFITSNFETKHYCISLSCNNPENVSVECFNYDTFSPRTRGVLQIEQNSALGVESVAFLQTPGNPKDGKNSRKSAPIKVFVKSTQMLPNVDFSSVKNIAKADQKREKAYSKKSKSSKSKGSEEKKDDDDKNFIQKYWMYILAALILFVAPK